MELKAFTKKFKEALQKEPMTKEQKFEVIERSVKNMARKHPNKFPGYENLIIANEELAELSQCISKQLRCIGNKFHLIEELADTLIGIEYIKLIYNITEKDIEAAQRVKLERLNYRLAEEESCHEGDKL